MALNALEDSSLPPSEQNVEMKGLMLKFVTTHKCTCNAFGCISVSVLFTHTRNVYTSVISVTFTNTETKMLIIRFTKTRTKTLEIDKTKII